jgi:nitrite reductase (NAD(P)H)
VGEQSDGRVYLRLSSVQDLDRLLGAERWKVKTSEAQDPFAEMDRKIARNGRVRSARPEVLGARG